MRTTENPNMILGQDRWPVLQKGVLRKLLEGLHPKQTHTSRGDHHASSLYDLVHAGEQLT